MRPMQTGSEWMRDRDKEWDREKKSTTTNYQLETDDEKII